MPEASYIPDSEALRRLIEIFDQASPDSREKLLLTVSTFLGFGNPRQITNSGNAALSQGPISAGQQLASFTEDRSLSPKEFIRQKQPQTDVERVACLAYYLTHYRDTPYFKTVDISRLNTEAAQTKFSNAAMAVNNASLRGYLVSGPQGSKQVSVYGEQYVAALPDRHAARAAMTKRPRRRSKRGPVANGDRSANGHQENE